MYKTYTTLTPVVSPTNKRLIIKPSVKESLPPDGLWCATQPVIAKPDMHVLDILPSYEFIVMACDGLWDVFTNQEVVDFVRKSLYNQGNIHFVAQDLIAYALEWGSSDNISALIICLNQVSVNSIDSV